MTKLQETEEMSNPVSPENRVDVEVIITNKNFMFIDEMKTWISRVNSNVSKF